MKNVITVVSVILISAVIMLVPQLIHTNFQLVNVDWQTVVVNSLIVDAGVYLATIYANKTKAKNVK